MRRFCMACGPRSRRVLGSQWSQISGRRAGRSFRWSQWAWGRYLTTASTSSDPYGVPCRFRRSLGESEIDPDAEPPEAGR